MDEGKDPAANNMPGTDKDRAPSRAMDAKSKAENHHKGMAIIKGLLDSDQISPAHARKLARETGLGKVVVKVAGKRDNSKYTKGQLHEMRKKNGCGRPPKKNIDAPAEV